MIRFIRVIIIVTVVTVIRIIRVIWIVRAIGLPNLITLTRVAPLITVTSQPIPVTLIIRVT